MCVCVCHECVGSAAGLSPAVDLHTGAGENRARRGSCAHLWTGTVDQRLSVYQHNFSDKLAYNA